MQQKTTTTITTILHKILISKVYNDDLLLQYALHTDASIYLENYLQKFHRNIVDYLIRLQIFC